MSRTSKRFTMPLVCALVLWACMAAQAAPPAAASDDSGLLPMIPEEAVFFIERRGHDAVHEAFTASNLGQMAADEAIQQFVNDSRVKCGKVIVRGMFNLTDDADITRHQELLHSLLKPFWYNPCAMFVLVDKEGREPGLGFICVTGKHANECKTALETLMKVGVPGDSKAGTRQAFTYKSGSVTWQGVAKSYEEFTLAKGDARPMAEQLKGRSLFMAHWMGHILCVATDLRAADAMGKVLAVTDKTAKGKIANESLQVVMKKTALKDWAFRWYLDVDAVLKLMKGLEGRGSQPMTRYMKVLGLDKVRGIGGTGGYADNVFARMTYVDSPNTTGGLLRVCKMGGSYKQGLSMVPESTFCLAGALDTSVLTKLIRDMTLAGETGSESEEVVSLKTNEPAGAAGTGSTPATRGSGKLSETAEKVMQQIELLAEASGGSAAFFVTDLQGLVGMAMGSGPPVGFVLDLKDPAKAEKAVDALVELAQGKKGDDAEDKSKGASEYRKIKVRQVEKMLRIAILKDRMVLAMDDTAMKAAIDAALDKTGGFAPGGKAETLTKLAGNGASVFMMDLAAIAKLGWPILMKFAEMPGGAEQFPFTSLPSTEKMVRMLGPEVAVLEGDAGGLLMKSRGKIPFATKFILAYPMAGYSFFLLMH